MSKRSKLINKHNKWVNIEYRVNKCVSESSFLKGLNSCSDGECMVVPARVLVLLVLVLSAFITKAQVLLNPWPIGFPTGERERERESRLSR